MRRKLIDNKLLCKHCNEMKDLSDFNKDSCRSYGASLKCRACIEKKSLELRQNPEYMAKLLEQKTKARERMYNKIDTSLELYIPTWKKHWLKKTYNLDYRDYIDMYNNQKGLCMICHKPETAIKYQYNRVKMLSVDHNHETGEVRGLLCSTCNNGLGCFKDNIVLMNNALSYIIMHNYPIIVEEFKNKS